jgi:hypothetical protein
VTLLLRAELETGCLKEAPQRSALYRQMVPLRVLPRRRSRRIIALVRSTFPHEIVHSLGPRESLFRPQTESRRPHGGGRTWRRFSMGEASDCRSPLQV